MIDVTQIEDDLYPLISGITGIETIISHQSDPRPATPYIVYEVNSINQIGRGNTGYIDDSGMADSKADSEMVVRVTAIGPSSRTTALTLRSAMNQSQNLLDFCQAGFAYSRSTPVVHVPSILETDWEERATFDLSFYISDEYLEDIGIIETVIVESCYGFINFYTVPDGLSIYVFNQNLDGSYCPPSPPQPEDIILTHTLTINTDDHTCP